MGLSLREPSRRGGLKSPELIALYPDASVGAEESAVLGNPRGRGSPSNSRDEPGALVPRPAVSLRFFHGVPAPPARWRTHAVRHGRPIPELHARDLSASFGTDSPTAHRPR
jgi:hypothetical protein